MRKLTEKEKEELKAKIEAFGVRQGQKEQKLIAHKHQYRVVTTHLVSQPLKMRRDE